MWCEDVAKGARRCDVPHEHALVDRDELTVRGAMAAAVGSRWNESRH
jgi:hypothetical protein